MPTVFSHVVAATALGQLYPGRSLPPRFWAWSAFCSVLPDADVIGFFLGIPYGDMLGHRGLSHSLLFAAVTGAVVARLYLATPGGPAASARSAAASHAEAERRREGPPLRVHGLDVTPLAIYFSLITASHGLLDALTDGGRGVAFLAPIDATRYFFPWRPIEVSPIGPSFFSARGLDVIVSEMRWIWLPSLLLAAGVGAYRRINR